MEWFIFWLSLNGLVGYAIGKSKNDVSSGVMLSLLLGPIGWLIALASKGNVRKCPFCAEEVKLDAVVCRYCHRDLPKASSAAASPQRNPNEIQLQPITRRAKIGWTIALVSFVLFCAGLILVQNLEQSRSPAVASPLPTPSSTVPATAPVQTLISQPADPSIVVVKAPVTLASLDGAKFNVTVPAGTELRLVSRSGGRATVKYRGEFYSAVLP